VESARRGCVPHHRGGSDRLLARPPARPSDPEAVGLLGVAAAVFAVLLAILISYAALEKIHEGGYYRLLAAVAVVDVLFVTLQAAVRRFGAAPATVVAPGPSLTPSATGFVCVLADGRRVARRPRRTTYRARSQPRSESWSDAASGCGRSSSAKARSAAGRQRPKAPLAAPLSGRAGFARASV